MEVVNPFNRVPETEEALAMGCGCYCSTGSQDNKDWSWLPWEDCHCSCDYGPDNKVANYDEGSAG